MFVWTPVTYGQRHPDPPRREATGDADSGNFYRMRLALPAFM